MLKKLPVDFKTKWLEALRSGKYTQAAGQLRDGNGFCCLGVACDLVNPDTWVSYIGTTVFHTVSGARGFPRCADLPPEVMEVLSQYRNDKPIMNLLAEFNDVDSTFIEIAQWIEENL